MRFLTKKGLYDSGRVLFLPVEDIAPNPGQPRTQFSQPELEELAGSIRALGLLQPLTVRRGEGVYLAAILAVVGHLKPLYFGFKGGKGVLVAGGAILAIQPVLLPFLALIFLACLLPTGMVSLGSVTMAAAYPLLTLGYCLLRGYAVQDLLICLVGSVIMAAMVIYMHRSNIQRIRDGKEYRFGRHGKQ